jgi:VanZ family protein
MVHRTHRSFSFTVVSRMLNFLVKLLTAKRYQRLRLYGAFIIYLLIVGICSVPGTRQSIGEVASGLVLHSLAYAGITLLLFTGLDSALWRRTVFTFLIVAGMGALDECIQSFFPYRNGTVRDWYVDVSACLLVLSALAATVGRYYVSNAKPILNIQRDDVGSGE